MLDLLVGIGPEDCILYIVDCILVVGNWVCFAFLGLPQVRRGGDWVCSAEIWGGGHLECRNWVRFAHFGHGKASELPEIGFVLPNWGAGESASRQRYG